MTPIKCDTCGKNIDKGKLIYSLNGLTCRCCSVKCLLYALYGKITIKINEGDDEEDDD